MCRKFFVRYFIETPNSIGKRLDIEAGKANAWKFEFNEATISLYDCKSGLFADFYIDAESLSSAEEKSMTLIENILNLIDFSSSSASSPSLLFSSYDASHNVKEREFKQVFYLPVSERNINNIDEKIFSNTFDVIKRNIDERIIRAISWLRKAYLELNHIDKFLSFWIGLEAINELLCDFYKIPDEERKLRCRKCGESLYPITKGIEKLFIDDLKIEKSQFNKIRETRGKLSHGGGPLDNNFINEVKQYIPSIKNALIIGIGKLLSINNDIIEKITLQKSKKYDEKIRFIIKANLIDFNPPKIEEFTKQPRIELSDRNWINRMVDNQGKFTRTDQMKLKLLNGNLNKIVYEVWTEDGTCISSIKINET